jgi:hypothetical protein
MQKHRFDKVQDSLEAAINEMQRTRELLKKIADMARDDEVCFRLHYISSLLEKVVGRSWDIYQDEPGDFADGANWSCNWIYDVD